MRFSTLRLAAPLLVLALAASAPRSAPAAVATPPAPGVPFFVQLDSLSGLPADSLVRHQFMAGFRGEFTAELLPAERATADDAWESAPPLSNRFKFLEGDRSEDAWRLQVVLGSPPAVVLPTKSNEHGHRSLESRRRSRGMIAALTVQAPDPGGGPPPPVQARFGFAFPPGAADSSAAMSVPGVGYVFPWNEAGHAVARLALEVLHHERGDLGRDVRLAIAPAIRTESGR